MTLTVTVIISHVNSERTLEKSLRMILENNYPDFRVIVVDAGSTDGSIEIVRKLQTEVGNRLILIVEPGCSESEGQMTGVRAIESDIVAFTNSDIYVPKDWIERHIAWINRGFDVVGGRCLWDGDDYTRTWNMALPGNFSPVQTAGLGLGFSNSSIRKDYLMHLGGLKKMVAHQDTEFAFQTVKRQGRFILDFRIEVVHDHPFKSVRGSFWRSYGYARNHLVVMRSVFKGKLYHPKPVGMVEALLYSAVNLPRESLLLNGVMAWKVYRNRLGFSMGLPRFLFIRWFGWLLGHLIGSPVGLLIRNPSLEKVTNLHTRRFAGRA